MAEVKLSSIAGMVCDLYGITYFGVMDDGAWEEVDCEEGYYVNELRRIERRGRNEDYQGEIKEALKQLYFELVHRANNHLTGLHVPWGTDKSIFIRK